MVAQVDVGGEEVEVQVEVEVEVEGDKVYQYVEFCGGCHPMDLKCAVNHHHYH